MSQEQFKLAYLNEDDRAYGLAGMDISSTWMPKAL